MLLDEIKAGMNQNRLSTSPAKSEQDKILLYSKKNKFLSMLSNYEERNGKL